MFTELKYKAPATATFDATAVTADITGELKEQAAARFKRADIENEKYELSKPSSHSVCTLESCCCLFLSSPVVSAVTALYLSSVNMFCGMRPVKV